MSKTIRRGVPPRRTVQPGRRVPAIRRQSMIDRLLRALPISERALQRLATGAFLAMIAVGAIGLATLFGVPQAAGVAIAEGVGTLGFRVEGIEVTGARHMNMMTVYATALEQKSRAMPLVDLAGVRAKLLRYPWIADAQVSRRLPDRIVIHIVERRPAAIWQQDGALSLVDASGVVLEPVSADAMPDLPLLIGEGANTRADAYRALLDAAPALRPRVKAATWVGDRRWNLLFASGETLVLPEDAPERALIKFAEIDGAQQLLGHGWLRFDMRDPTRLVARRGRMGAARTASEAATTGTEPPAQNGDA